MLLEHLEVSVSCGRIDALRYRVNMYKMRLDDPSFGNFEALFDADDDDDGDETKLQHDMEWIGSKVSLACSFDCN